jgi:hypothetical protein
MDTRGAQWSLRDTRVVQNLPLRRRCLFLSNPRFLDVCFSWQDPAARARAASTADLMRTFLPRLTGAPSPLSAAHVMLDRLTAVSAASQPSTDASSSTSWAGWEEAVETLLSFLEEPQPIAAVPGSVTHRSGGGDPDPTSAPRTATAATPSVCATSVTAAAGNLQQETDTEATVRQLLCTLVRHLYDCGAAFYAEESNKARITATATAPTAATAQKRGRYDDDDGVETSAVLGGKPLQHQTGVSVDPPMRLTWSIAAPISSVLRELYRA